MCTEYFLYRVACGIMKIHGFECVNKHNLQNLYHSTSLKAEPRNQSIMLPALIILPSYCINFQYNMITVLFIFCQPKMSYCKLFMPIALPVLFVKWNTCFSVIPEPSWFLCMCNMWGSIAISTTVALNQGTSSERSRMAYSIYRLFTKYRKMILHKREVQFQKLLRLINSFLILHGHNICCQQWELCKFLMRYQQFASHAYYRTTGPVSKMASQQ
jgi:hypothetical protein